MAFRALVQSFENLTIRRKVLYSTIVMFVFIGILSSIANWLIFIPSVIEQIQIQSMRVAHSLVTRCRPRILSNNLPMLTGILFQTKGMETGLAYVFVTDAKNQILAHTFFYSIPHGIEKANQLEPYEDEKVQLITVRGKSVYDTAVSIKEGLKKIGTVHVGVEKKPVDAITLQIGMTLTAVMLIIILLAGLLSSMVATYISKPLLRLIQAMNDLSAGKTQQLPRFFQKLRCWEVMNCTEDKCPVYQKDDLFCWLTGGILRHGKEQKSFPEKMEACHKCSVYKMQGENEIVQISNAFINIISTVQSAADKTKASEEKYRLLFNYDPNPLFVVNMDSGKILDVNDLATITYGYEREEMIEMSFEDLFDADEADRFWKELHHFPGKEYIFLPKVWARKKDGHHFFIDLHARVGKFQKIQNGGLALSLIVRTVDITQRLEREAQLTQASKMATLGEMATGIAHELNQPLNVMRVGADFLAKMIKRGQKVSEKQLLEVSCNISEQVDRASNIISHLRAFGRKSDLKVYPVDLNEPIRAVFTILGQQLKLRDIKVRLNLDKDLPKILADKNRLEQIFLNLVTNARDAMEAKGPKANKEITITTSQAGNRVMAVVSDTGTGMPDSIRQKIFEPFFTTKEVGKGTGVGLSITYTLVKDFKGDIDVESTLGVGTTFKLSFPVYQEKGGPHEEIVNH